MEFSTQIYSHVLCPWNVSKCSRKILPCINNFQLPNNIKRRKGSPKICFISGRRNGVIDHQFWIWSVLKLSKLLWSPFCSVTSPVMGPACAPLCSVQHDGTLKISWCFCNAPLSQSGSITQQHLLFTRKFLLSDWGYKCSSDLFHWLHHAVLGGALVNKDF